MELRWFTVDNIEYVNVSPPKWNIHLEHEQGVTVFHRTSMIFTSPDMKVFQVKDQIGEWYRRRIPMKQQHQELRVLYMYCGIAREGDMRWWLQRYCDILGWTLIMTEMDTVRHASHNLLDPATQTRLLTEARAHKFHLAITSPDCSTFSRARHYEPTERSRPIRSYTDPYGDHVPRTDKERADVARGNNGVRFSFNMCEAVHAAGGIFVYEHPEYLGRVRGSDIVPTSSFLWQEFKTLAATTNLIQVAVHQCRFGTPHAKPTRFATTAFSMQSSRHIAMGPIELSNTHQYLGPLRHCNHQHGKRNNDQARGYSTTGSEQYPPSLCSWLSRHLIQTWLDESSAWQPLSHPIDMNGE